MAASGSFGTSAIGGTGGSSALCLPVAGAYSGGNGAAPAALSSGGGGGGSAGGGGTGTNAGSPVNASPGLGGAAGTLYVGASGGAGGSSNANGIAGNVPGGGGGGKGNLGAQSGKGADGLVYVTWPCVAVNVSNFSIAAVTACTGSTSRVTVTSTSMASGVYMITYTLGGANASGPTFATLTFSGTTGYFDTALLPSSGATSVTVSNVNCTAVSSGNIANFTVNASPSPTFTAQAGSSVCVGVDVTYTTQAGQTNYVWVVPGVLNTDYSITSGGIGTTSNSVTLKWLTAGSKTVTINYSNANGCAAATATSSTVTTVNALAAPSFTAQPGASACISTDVTYTTQSGQTNYIWVVPGTLNTDYTITTGGIGTTSNTVTLQWITTGSKTVSINYSNPSGCSTAAATSSTATTVYALPVPSFTAEPGATACAGTDVTYTTQSGQTNYLWSVPGTLNTDYTITSGGIGTTSNSITLKWLTTGSKSVSINYTNPGGCTATSATTGIATTVNASPSPTFTAQAGTGICVGVDVTYTTESGQNNYAWVVPGTLNTDYSITSGGLGASSNTVTLRWLTTGSKTVTINYKNSNGCSAATPTSSVATTVNSLAAPTFITQPGAKACAGIDVTYTTESGQSNYVWVVPGILNTDYSITSGGVGPTDNTVTLQWITIGSKTVTVNYNNSTGCSAATSTSSTATTVSSPPTPTFTVQPGANACIGIDVTYTTQSGGDQANYIWGVPGTLNTDYSITSGGIGTTNSSVTLKWLIAGGSRIVTVNYDNASGCTGASSASSTPTTINPLPSPTFTSQAGSTVCEGIDVTYTTQSGQSNYIWGVPGTLNTDYTITSGGTGTSSNSVTLKWLTTGNKTVTINYTNGNGCTAATATSSTSATVNGLPAPSFTVQPGATACVGSNVTYTTQSGQSNYTWVLPGTLNTDYLITSGGIGTSSNTVTLQWLTSGSKTVTINYNNAGGCPAAAATSSTATIVNALPAPTFTVQPGSSACVGSDVTYTTQSGQTNYTWVVPGVLNTDYSITSGGIGITNNSVTLKWLTTGSKTVTINYNNANGCSAGSATSSTATTVNPTPTIAIQTAATCAPNLLSYSVSVIVNGGTVTSGGVGTITNVGNVWTISGILETTTSVVLTVNNGSCQSSLTVNAPNCNCPVLNAPVSGGNPQYCAGTTVPSVSATVGAGETVDWYAAATGGTVLTGGAGTLTYSPGTAGTYYAETRNTTSACTSSTRTAVTITVNALPTATIAYAGTPYCGIGTATVTQTGPAAGVFSSTAGLSINGSTGDINLAASTAGSYTVTYTFTNGTCQNSATTGVVINALPTAAISYAGSPYCATGTAAVTRTGQAGGVYSSTTGLALDVATGAIDLTNSTPGLYTVNYDYTNGTCTSTASTSLTINPLPTVEVITGVFDIIIGTTTQLSDLTTGGVWSSSTPAVASINASTGLVTSHAVGSATITYTYTNGNTCSSFVTQLVTVSPTGGILRITPITLHKAYGTVLTNGSVSSSYFTVTGLVGGDLITDVDFAYLAAKAANSPVGTYKGKVDVSSAVGNASFNPSNYTIFYTAGDIIIDPVPLTVTANDTTKTFGKILTGGPGSKSFTSSGLVNGETIGTVTMAYGPGALANAPAGPYYGQVIPSVATGGTSFVPGNYIITYKNGSIYVGQTGELTIIANKVSKTYGTVLSGHSLYSGISVIGSQGEAITVDVSYSSGGLATDTAGIYKGAVVISNAQNLAAAYTKINYVSGDLTVNPKALSISANSKHKPYGTTIVAPGVGAHPSEFSVSGLVNGQLITSATVNYGPGDDALDPVNTYFGSITISAPVGNSTFNPKNYAITYSPGDITVDPLSLTITALGVSKPYGTTLLPHRAGLSEFSYNKSQLVNGDSIGTVAISYGTGASAGSVGPKYLGSVIAAYPVGAKFNAGNYSITYVPGDITITKGKVTVTADTRNKCYDGLVYSGPYSYTAVGLAPGDVLSGTPVYGGPGGPGTIAKNPGLYPITIGGFASNPLYDITYPAAGGNLSINELPSATVVADTAICAGTSLNIGASSGPGTRNYNWTSSTPGETLANQPNPYVTPAVNTTYTLVETITATGCSNHHSALVTVKPQLTANAGPDQEICFGGTVTIGTPGVAGNTYTWTNGDGAVVSNLANPTLSPQNGTFYTLTVSKPGSCSATDGVLVNVIPKPSPHISVVPSANLVCFDSEVVYTTESGMFGYVWTWSGGTKIAGGASTDNSVTIKWNVEGAQKVTVTYSSGPNCATGTIAESTLSISSAPAAPGAISGLTAICAPSNNVVYSVAPITGVSSYVWSVSSPGATIISGQFTSSITVNFDATATAGTVSVYGQNDCRAGATSSLAYELTQKPLAAGIITGEPNFVLNSSGVYSVSPVENATDYTWTVPSGVTITKGVTPNIVTLNFGPAAVAGDLYVVGTNSCPGVGDKSPVISLTVPPKSSIIYPVPNSGIFRAKITFPEETTFNIAVYDPLGNMVREILDAKTSQGVYDQEINLGSVSSGLYVLLFYNSKIKIEHKIQIHK
ncbi:MAG: MBG domain-containing protein [Mariniphaga sp.]